MANRLSMAEISAILTLHKTGHSNRRIAELLGVHRETVGRYVARWQAENRPATPPGSDDSTDQNRPNAPPGSDTLEMGENLLQIGQYALQNAGKRPIKRECSPIRTPVGFNAPHDTPNGGDAPTGPKW